MPLYEQAKQMYIEGISLRGIEDAIGYPRKKLSRKLKEEGIFRVFHDGSSLATKCTYEEPIHYEIVEYYLSGASMKDMETVFNVSDSTINRILFYHNINTRRSYRTYKLDENVFEKIDSEEKAYWLGFLYADGYVRNDLSAIELCLKERDRDHVIRFKKFLKTNAPITDKQVILDDKTYPAAKITVCSKKLANDLSNLGCFNNKSLTVTFPDFLEEHLVHHFIRGYFDGDGSVTKSRNKETHSETLMVSILGTHSFLQELCARIPFAEDYLSFDDRSKNEEGQAFSVAFHGNVFAEKFGNFIYEDSTIYLPRKYDIFAVVL